MLAGITKKIEKCLLIFNFESGYSEFHIPMIIFYQANLSETAGYFFKIYLTINGVVMVLL